MPAPPQQLRIAVTIVLDDDMSSCATLSADTGWLASR